MNCQNRVIAKIEKPRRLLMGTGKSFGILIECSISSAALGCPWDEAD